MRDGASVVLNAGGGDDSNRKMAEPTTNGQSTGDVAVTTTVGDPSVAGGTRHVYAQIGTASQHARHPDR
jgi:hypothetical protein